MSGGHFDYLYHKVEEMGSELAIIRSPEEIELGRLLKDLSQVLHDVEWYYSGDTSEEDFIKAYKEFKEKWLKT